MDNCSSPSFDKQHFGQILVWEGSPGSDQAHSSEMKMIAGEGVHRPL